mgnify:CR=1 FL=1
MMLPPLVHIPRCARATYFAVVFFLLAGLGAISLPSAVWSQGIATQEIFEQRVRNIGNNYYGDTTDVEVLDVPSFIAGLQAYHPVLRQADLLPERARRSLQQVRGQFDPAIVADFNRKIFKDTRYYDNLYTALKVPTLPNINFVGGFEQSVGTFNNPEASTPSEGLIYAGVEVPIGGDLVMDARRNALRQAQLLPRLAQAEQLKLMNKLIFSAMKVYLEWQQAFFQRELARQGVQLAEFRFRGVRERAFRGDAAFIDTTEALLEVQKRRITLQEAELDLEVAKVELDNFLWTPDGLPAELPENVVPGPYPAEVQAVSLAKLEEMVAMADSLHPELQKLAVKNEQLAYELRFQQMQLVPSLNISYKPLFVPTNLETGFSTISENYKFGVGFYVPILLRKQRAKVALTELKQNMLRLDIDNVRLNVVNGVIASHRRLTGFEQLYRTQDAFTDNASRMLLAEMTKFQIGESSLFVVNRRERSLLSAQRKLISLQMKFFKALAELYFSAGQNPATPFVE